MNEYHAIARNYLRRVEGWHLYRAHGDRLLWLWLCAASVWVIAFVPLLRAIGDWPRFGVWFFVVIVLELAVLLTGDRIRARKREAMTKAVNAEFATMLATEPECREFLLTKLLARSANQFFSTTKEISDLLDLRKKFRGSNELEAEFYVKAIYDPESKPRLLAVTLAAITVMTALIIRSLPEGALLFELFESPGIWGALFTVLVISGAGFLMLIGARAILSVIWNALSIWIAKTISSEQSRTALRYLARDLLLFHRPVVVEPVASGLQGSTEQSRSEQPIPSVHERPEAASTRLDSVTAMRAERPRAWGGSLQAKLIGISLGLGALALNALAKRKKWQNISELSGGQDRDEES